jgi:hypothetical protein
MLIMGGGLIVKKNVLKLYLLQKSLQLKKGLEILPEKKEKNKFF